MCLTPITIQRNYASQKGVKTAIVPCGKCLACLKRRSQSWSFRLEQENKVSSSSYFLTLTYDKFPISNNGYATLVKSDLQKFFKRLRKKSINRIKYYSVGEYGSMTKRPHYHAIVFNMDKILIKDLESIWSHGFVHVGNVNQASIRYVTNYVVKPDSEHFVCKETGLIDDRVPQYSAMSKKLGINYLTENMVNFHLDTMTGCIVREGGQIIAMPRYFKEKIFSKTERIKLTEEYQQLRQKDFNKILTSEEHRDHVEKVKAIERRQHKEKQLKRTKL